MSEHAPDSRMATPPHQPAADREVLPPVTQTEGASRSAVPAAQPPAEPPSWEPPTPSDNPARTYTVWSSGPPGDDPQDRDFRP